MILSSLLLHIAPLLFTPAPAVMENPNTSTPLSDKKDYFIPAVKRTTVLLKEAAGVASIKKVVITSSRAALIPLTGMPAGGIVKEDNDWDFSVDENASFEVPNDPDATAFRLYHASKLLSNNAAWSFWRNEKPHYSLVSIHPAFVLGHNLVQSSPDEIGSNGVLWKLIMTGTFSPSVAGVHIQDVAEAHIKALNPDIPDGAKYLLVGKPITWKEVAQIMDRDYPNVGIKISMEAEGGTMPCDNTKTEQELGMKWRSWEQMIHEVMDQQLGLVKESTI
ncbi:hypothetical protein V498_07998 [Pseudogymnoascus sp. VKM F-4517 (FW-2822)]|nr:hypothetical protein V498_07998 [Pseudogymnoascus sp. VKM F-4517 (FW-2822)]